MLLNVLKCPIHHPGTLYIYILKPVSLVLLGMRRNGGLKFDSASNVEGKIRRRPSNMEKSGKKPGLHLTMQSAEMAVQKLPSTVAKSKTTTSASEPDLPSDLPTSTQVSIEL